MPRRRPARHAPAASLLSVRPLRVVGAASDTGRPTAWQGPAGPARSPGPWLLKAPGPRRRTGLRGIG
eukprot:762781-Hanusia_phi.AAC.7